VMSATPRICLSTTAFADGPAERALDFAIEHAFGGGTLADRAAVARRVARRASGLALSLHAPVAGTWLGADDEAQRRAGEGVVRDAVELAGGLGAEAVVVHLVRAPDGSATARRAAIDRAADALVRLADSAAAAGTTIGLENVGFDGADGTEALDADERDLAAIVAQLDHPNLGITFDVGHAHLRGGVGAAAALFGGRIVHAHLHDNDGSGDQHRAVGRGSIPTDALREALAAIGEALLVVELVAVVDRDMEQSLLETRDRLTELAVARVSR
jgi:sugar phosphate isomerase/epimerase